MKTSEETLGLINTHNPCLVALLETKLCDHLGLIHEFGFDDYWEDPSIGISGGKVLLWHTNFVSVTHKRQTLQELHAMIKKPPSPKAKPPQPPKPQPKLIPTRLPKEVAKPDIHLPLAKKVMQQAPRNIVSPDTTDIFTPIRGKSKYIVKGKTTAEISSPNIYAQAMSVVTRTYFEAPKTNQDVLTHNSP
ncbi:hypothetical protein BC332_30786 [Capsicum chinense]|nr:hypothetical protein BC332_30786 [Capsicum chinense]